jgi:hypothetical protein
LLLLRGHIRTAAISVLTVIVGLLLPAAFLGIDANWAVHGEWFRAMAAHNAALIYTGGDDLRSVNTVYSLVHRSILKHITGTPGNAEAYTLLGLIAGLFGIFVRWNKRREQRDGQGSAFVFEFLLLTALVPSITLTDTEHFLFAMPIVAFVVHRLWSGNDPTWMTVLGIPLLFAYGGNWEDAMGPLSALMVHYGLLGIGNVGLLVLAVLLFARSNQRTATASNRS